MTTTTLFNIGELVQTKYSGTQVIFFEIIEINSVTCIAGTQHYYIVRAFVPKYDNLFSKEKKVTSFDPAGRSNQEYSKYREDELIPASQLVHDTIKGL